MEYICNHIDQCIMVDGKIDEEVWQTAIEVSLVETETGLKPVQPTTAKLLWNDSFLYIAFTCKDDFINASMTGYNDPLYHEEVVEIFLDDDNDSKTYLEFEVNPLNALLHYEIHNDLSKKKIIGYSRIEKTVETAVFHDRENETWSVEIAIPFSEFLSAKNIPPKSGDRWGMNLYRIDRPEDGTIEHSAWSPTGILQFHLPQYFRDLVFQS